MSVPFAPLAIRQGAYEIFGCAVSYWTLRDAAPGEQTRYQPGCVTATIGSQKIELQVEYARYEFLANQRGGLRVFETPSGVYFEASMPETAYARAVFEAVRDQRLSKVCVIGNVYQTIPDGEGVVRVTAFDIYTINLLLETSMAHYPQAFVTADRAEFDRRRLHRDKKVRAWMSGRIIERITPAPLQHPT